VKLQAVVTKTVTKRRRMSKPDAGKTVAMSKAVSRVNELCRAFDMRLEANGKTASATKAFQKVITLTSSATKGLDATLEDVMILEDFLDQVFSLINKEVKK